MGQVKEKDRTLFQQEYKCQIYLKGFPLFGNQISVLSRRMFGGQYLEEHLRPWNTRLSESFHPSLCMGGIPYCLSFLLDSCIRTGLSFHTVAHNGLSCAQAQTEGYTLRDLSTEAWNRGISRLLFSFTATSLQVFQTGNLVCPLY